MVLDAQLSIPLFLLNLSSYSNFPILNPHYLTHYSFIVYDPPEGCNRRFVDLLYVKRLARFGKKATIAAVMI